MFCATVSLKRVPLYNFRCVLWKWGLNILVLCLFAFV